MIENKIGKTIYYIGVSIIVLGIIGSFIMGVNFDTDVPVFFIAGIVSSCVTGVCFIGFSEIITLLQKNVNQQQEIMSSIRNIAMGNYEKSPTKTVLQDIEDNLPKI